MSLKITVDSAEFIKFVKENNKLDSYQLGKKYDMSSSAMNNCLRSAGFIRIRTSDGMRYVMEKDINSVCGSRTPHPAQEINSKVAREPGSKEEIKLQDLSKQQIGGLLKEANDVLETTLNFSFTSCAPLHVMQVEVPARMKVLRKEIIDLKNELEKKGYSDRVSADKYEKVVLNVPRGLMRTIESAIMLTADDLIRQKPIEQWGTDQLARFHTLEGWIISSLYKIATQRLLLEDPKNLMTVPCSDEFKKHNATYRNSSSK